MAATGVLAGLCLGGVGFMVRFFVAIYGEDRRRICKVVNILPAQVPPEAAIEGSQLVEPAPVSDRARANTA